MPYSPDTIYQTNFTDLSESDVIWIHLNANPTFGCADRNLLSTLGLALTERRSAAVSFNTQLILPTLATFSILDQIGNTYECSTSTPIPHSNVNGIKLALHNFAGMSFDSPETKALYAFRNAMMHDASMVNRGKGGIGPFHRFSFNESQTCIVQLPSSPWDGTWGQAPYTSINRGMLVELADVVVRNARAAFDSGTLNLRIPIEELFDKYLLTSR